MPTQLLTNKFLPQNRWHLNGLWVLAAMLLLLHIAIWQDLNTAFSRSLMLAHLGMFFIWQPLWSREQRVAVRSALFFVVFTCAIIYWLNWWIIFGWLLLLIGLVAGQTIENITERRAYLLALVFLVTELLIRCVTELFSVSNLSSQILNLYKYGSLLLPIAIVVITWKHTPEKQTRPMDFFRGITMALITAMLAVGSLLNMYHSDVNYSVALFQSLLVLSVFLFALSWLSSPVIGFSGLAQLWEQSLMNIGTPFEQWLGELAKLSEQEKLPDKFVKAAMEKLEELPWVEGVYWELPQDEGFHGTRTRHGMDLATSNIKVSLYTRRAVGTSLQLHCKLLIQLVHHFHMAKSREVELMQRTHLQAIYETGARVTHDIKNLLQSLQTITMILEKESESEDPSQGQELLQRQLPYITQRLQLALDKLRDPADITIEHMSLETWWKKLQKRNSFADVIFQAELTSNPIIPYDLFDSVIENLLENARFKGQIDPDLEITVSLFTDDTNIKLSVCDSGESIPPEKIGKLFEQPLDSDSGLGIGLYQAGRQAELNDFQLKLVHNEKGRVCFQLSNHKREYLTPESPLEEDFYSGSDKLI